MRSLSNLIIILLCSSFTVAKIWTVDNKHPYVADYTTLTEAHNAASAGDTIYVYPSLQPYSFQTVTKQLTLIGVGFEITENFGEPVTPTTIIGSNYISFNAGSEGSQLIGFDGNFNVYINTSNILIKKNNLNAVIIALEGSGSVITQNKIIGNINTGSSQNYTVKNSAPNILVSNNIIVNTIGSSGFPRAIGDNANNSTIINNVLKSNYYPLTVSNCDVVNNILVSGPVVQIPNCSARYNMYYATDQELTDGIGNLQNIDMSTVFVDHGNNDFHLKAGSPAYGNGENGADMGNYGGQTPYVDSGFPGLPSILQINAPTVGSQAGGLNIIFDAKSNSE